MVSSKINTKFTISKGDELEKNSYDSLYLLCVRMIANMAYLCVSTFQFFQHQGKRLTYTWEICFRITELPYM